MTRSRWVLALRAIAWLGIVAAILGGAVLALRNIDRFAPFDLRERPGLLTGLHLRLFEADRERCFAALARNGVRFTPAPPKPDDDGCGHEDGVLLESSRVGYGGDLLLRCPAAASLLLWQRHVVEPAAERHLGKRLTGMRHLGTYACRNINHARIGRRSQHATANAIDIAGFAFADGTSVSLLQDWRAGGPEGRFLREARDGACRLFRAVLSPDYNALHRDHFHLDRGPRSVCR